MARPLKTIERDNAEAIFQAPALSQNTAQNSSSPRFDDEAETDAPDDVALMNLLEELGSAADDAKVMVYRVGRGGYSDLMFMESFRPSEFHVEALQEAPFNGGEFRVHIRAGGKLLANRALKVASKGQALVVAPVAAQQSHELNALALMVGKMAETMQSGFQQMAQMVADNRAPQKSTADTLQELQMYSTIFRQNQPAPAPVQTDPFEQMAKILEVAKVFQGKIEGAEPSGFELMSKALDTFAPVIAGALSNAPAPVPRPLPAPAPRPLPAPAPVASHPPKIQEPEKMNPVSLDVAVSGVPADFNKYAGMLLFAAQMNADPATYANMVLDFAGDDNMMQVLTFLEAPDWFEQLTAALPGALNRREWFNNLRKEIISCLTDEENSSMIPVNSSEPEPVNAAVGPDHAAPNSSDAAVAT